MPKRKIVDNDAKDKLTLKNQIHIMEEVISRASMAGMFDSGKKRDLDIACGYPDDITVTDYYNMYDRGDVASRVITAYPEYCWKEVPDVYEIEDKRITKFERAWKNLTSRNDISIFAALHSLDKLCGIGTFGVLLIGFNDGKELIQPVTDASDILYMQAFDETKVNITQFDTDTSSKRFSLPVMYSIQMSTGNTGSSITRDVHYTRIIHAGEGMDENPVYGRPRLKSVYNRFLDIKKVLGGSAEMFWKGGFPGTLFELDPEAEPTAASLTEMKEQIWNYENSLSRILRLQGVKPHALSVQIASPAEHLAAQFQTIAATTGIPARVLFGSEQAQLASGQDRKNWYDRVKARRNLFCIPVIVNPFVIRLQEVGILPEVKSFRVVWPEDNMMDTKEQADVARVMTEALCRYADSPLASSIMPFDQFMLRVLAYDSDVVRVIMEATQDEMNLAMKEDIEAEKELDAELNQKQVAVPETGDKSVKGY
jgi:hypothetical protein